MEPAESRPQPEIVLIAGQIGAGKSAVANRLERIASCRVVRAREALQHLLGGANWDRFELQRRGAELDARTNGRWLLEYLESVVTEADRWVLDAARTRRQTEPVLVGLDRARLVYLEATEATRRFRYALGQEADPVKRSTVFEHAMRHNTETEASALRAMSSLVVATDDLSVEQVAAIVCDHVKWSCADG